MSSVSIPEINKSKKIQSAGLTMDLPAKPIRFFRHGWQSWSLAAWTDINPLPVQQPAILHPLQVDPVYVFDLRPNGSWLGAVKFEDGNDLLLGSLGLETHVALNGDQLEGWSEAGKVEWFIAYGEEKAIFTEYANQIGHRFGKPKKKPAPRIWCSWYSLYTAIDEALLYRVFDELGDLPFDFLQVDDGWQIKIGDWEANTKFPSGMTALAHKIKSTGRKAGLWLAPLIAVKSSRLYREHPDWFLRDEKNRFVSAGFNWGEQLYALDTTRPAVLEWLAALMRQVREWGFDYLKLDFLYAGALPGNRYEKMPREAAYRNGLKVLREAMGADAFFLACGAPILPSLGLCDALRIGPDVSGEWESYRDATLLYNPTTPGTKNAIRTTANRLWLAQLVYTDPDVAYFSSRGNQLSNEQKRLLQDMAKICNFKGISELPQWLSWEEHHQLRDFLLDNSSVKETGEYKFQVDERIVDFAPAMDLPEPPKGFELISSRAIGWLGNRVWVLKVLDQMGKRSAGKMKEELSKKRL